MPRISCAFLRNSLRRFGALDELEAETTGATLEVVEHAPPVALFVVLSEDRYFKGRFFRSRWSDSGDSVTRRGRLFALPADASVGLRWAEDRGAPSTLGF
jgi:hypothetical protein